MLLRDVTSNWILAAAAQLLEASEPRNIPLKDMGVWKETAAEPPKKSIFSKKTFFLYLSLWGMDDFNNLIITTLMSTTTPPSSLRNPSPTPSQNVKFEGKKNYTWVCWNAVFSLCMYKCVHLYLRVCVCVQVCIFVVVLQNSSDVHICQLTCLHGRRVRGLPNPLPQFFW